MLKKKNILFMGPVPPPVHGQSIAFLEAFKGIRCSNKFLVNQNVTEKPLILKLLVVSFAIFKIVFYLLFLPIDVVYFSCSRSKHGSLLDIILIHLSKLFNAKLISHLQGVDFRHFYESLHGVFRKLVHNSYSRVDVSIVLLEEMKQQFSPFFPNVRLEVIPNFYVKALEVIQTKSTSSRIRIVYLSNILKSKGILDLLDAFHLLADKHDNLSLTIAGDFMGDSLMARKEIRELFFRKLDKLKQIAKGKIDYVGAVSGDRKVSLLQNSDIFVLPTYYAMEAVPLSIVEAMRAGNVIISTKHNYLPSIVSEKQGYLVDIKSPVAIEKAVTRLIQNRDRMRSIQEYNMSYAKSTYSLDKYLERLTSVFESV